MKKAGILLFFCFLLFCPFVLSAQEQYRVDSLTTALKNATDYKAEVATLIQLAAEYRRADKQKSQLYSNRALKLSAKKEYTKGEATAYYHLGVAASYAQDYLESIEYQKKALEKYILLDDVEWQANCIVQIGTLQIHRGENAEAIEYLQKCIPIYKEIKDSIELANCYNNISIAYFHSENIDKAEEYLIKARALYSLIEEGQEVSLFNVNLGLGNISDSKKNFKQAVDYYQACLKTANKLDNNEMRFMAIASLGNTYNSLEKFDLALAFIKQGIKIKKQLGNSYELTICYADLSETYRELKNWDKALAALDSSLKYVTKNNYWDDMKSINLNYSLIYEQKGDYRKALEARKEYAIYRDSLLIKKNTEKINELTVKYETEQKENEIIQLKSEKQANEIELIKNARQRNMTLGLTALLLLSLVFSYFYWRQKQLANKKTIALNKERIDALINENKINYVNAMIEGQEAERKRLAEDLHDRLGSILATMKLHLSSTIEGGIEKAKSLLDESVDEVRKISHNLASISLVKFGLVASLQSLSESISSDDLKVDFIHHGIDERLPSKTAIALYRCVQELVSNVLKHSGATKLSIQLQKNEDHINLIVEDNGKGFDASKDFAGIGLKNIKSRVDSIHGQINFDSTPQRGTTVIIDIPKVV